MKCATGGFAVAKLERAVVAFGAFGGLGRAVACDAVCAVAGAVADTVGAVGVAEATVAGPGSAAAAFEIGFSAVVAGAVATGDMAGGEGEGEGGFCTGDGSSVTGTEAGIAEPCCIAGDGIEGDGVAGGGAAEEEVAEEVGGEEIVGAGEGAGAIWTVWGGAAAGPCRAIVPVTESSPCSRTVRRE
jgi:hypothetical protein